MKPEEALRMTEQLESRARKDCSNDILTKRKVVSYFSDVKRLIKYQIKAEPINVSEGGRYFDCPRCREKFETEGSWSVDDFMLCPKCGQRFKGEELCLE